MKVTSAPSAFSAVRTILQGIYNPIESRLYAFTARGSYGFFGASGRANAM
jgi:hypothetical protein